MALLIGFSGPDISRMELTVDEIQGRLSTPLAVLLSGHWKQVLTLSNCMKPTIIWGTSSCRRSVTCERTSLAAALRTERGSSTWL